MDPHTGSRAWPLWSPLSLRLPMREVHVAGFLLFEVLQYPLKVIYFAFCPLTTPPPPSVHGPTPTCGHLRPCVVGGSRQALWSVFWVSSGKEFVLGRLVHLGNCMVFIDCIYCQCLYPILRFMKRILVSCCSEKVCWRHQFTKSTEMCSVCAAWHRRAELLTVGCWAG